MRHAQQNDQARNAAHGEDGLTPGVPLLDFRLKRELCNKAGRRVRLSIFTLCMTTSCKV